MNKYLKMIGFYLMILVIIILAVSFLNPMQSEVKDLTYSQLNQDQWIKGNRKAGQRR